MNSQISCSPPPKVPNSAVIFSSYDFETQLSPPLGSVVIFECLDGYKFDVKSCGTRLNNYLQCTYDGTWTTPPVCVPLPKCKGPPPYLAKGRIERKTFVGNVAYPGEKIYYSCMDDYDISQPNFIECSNNGRWTALPSCQKKPPLCQWPPSVDNSVTIFENFNSGVPRAGDFKILGCKTGFVIEGNITCQCLADGTWTPAPRCRKHETKCGEFAVPQFASIHFQSYQIGTSAVPGDEVRIKCNSNYLIDGPFDISYCKLNGQWSPLSACIPEVPESCGAVPDLLNGNVTFTNVQGNFSKKGDIAWYQCDDKFELVGSAAIICQDKWSQLPYCRRLIADVCGVPPIVRNGFIKTSFRGPSKVGTIVSYQCVNGFELSSGNNGNVTCLENGRWSGVPSCKNITTSKGCGPVPEILNGVIVEQNLVGNNSTAGSYAAIGCRQNNILKGPARIQCLTDGTWSKVPKCVARPASTPEITCGPVPTVANGFVYQTSIPEGEKNSTIGDIIWFTCDSSFKMIGQPSVECLQNGQFTPIPKCIDQTKPSCLNEFNFIFVVDLVESTTFSRNDLLRVEDFLKQFPSTWQRKFQSLNTSNLPLQMSLGLTFMKKFKFPQQTIETVVNVSSNPNKVNESLSKWIAWIDGNFASASFILHDDLAKLFSTTRTKLVPLCPSGNSIRVIYLTSNFRQSSVVETNGEIAALHSIWAKIFVVAIGDGVADSNYQNTLKKEIASSPSNFKFFQNVQQMRIEKFVDDDAFINFSCS